MHSLLHNHSFLFVTGGVRSGKSSFAERLAEKIALETGGQLHYLATGVPSDPEMAARIEKHQQDRAAGKHCWRTVERSIQIGEIVDYFDENDIILMDCITTLLNNELFSTEQTWDEAFLRHIKEELVTGVIKLKNRAKAVIAVSNEVLYEPLISSELVFTYGKLLGQIHQRLVKEADEVFLIEAGLPLEMKGIKQ
ncbi:bifunctional adenosylcobinamide kinase/adenosylcobinamide-phosphate guanylyltransferase [Neobacillus mesonae]|uniref:Adenosylcobinamide kinase n=1 Tax=Neobacillus mesonae TaxID=1193713 RepID=A0A3Q9QTE7_9BACI|nr:bifunctional adenosylcobinamide kinase/adenosylcobinamide-phosphate guanylyltransferase [Neobacillus mesonae]AZU61803.1 hypothetical protein CHR53_11220 [Neobacillus mesonae]